MKDDTRSWLTYAGENLAAAEILQTQGLYNPCLQNVQQSIEKSLKAIFLEKAYSQRKTHPIAELVRLLANQQISIRLAEEDCDLLDSISTYLQNIPLVEYCLTLSRMVLFAGNVYLWRNRLLCRCEKRLENNSIWPMLSAFPISKLTWLSNSTRRVKRRLDPIFT
jgi:HEPN domain-containing protein